MNTPTNLLSHDFLLKLSRLAYLFEKRASLEEGLSKGSLVGGSFEFEDYRSYHPGDDLRHLDWNVYARIEKFYLKRFARERDQFVTLYLDLSRKMDFGTPNKFDIARQLAAGFGYLALHQKCRIKIFAGKSATTDSKVFRHLREVKSFLRYLMTLSPEESEGIKTTCRRILPHRPQLTIFFSDFFEPNLFPELQFLLERKLNYGLIQILAPEEEQPKFLGWWSLKSLDSQETKEVRLTSTHLNQYKHQLALYRESLRQFGIKHQVPFLSQSSRLPFEKWMEMLHVEGNFFSR